LQQNQTNFVQTSGRVAHVAFLKSDFEILASLNIFGFFTVRKAWLWQNILSELRNHYKSHLTRVYGHAGCTEFCKGFAVALKMIDVIDKK